MADPSNSQRVFLLGNEDKPDVAALLDELREFAADRCEVVGAGVGLDGRVAVEAGANRIIVLGGDGTLIGVARSLEADQIPLVGVNVGKLGFLVEFTLDDLKEHFSRAIGDDGIISRRTMLQVTVEHNGGERYTKLAVNDCVIQAGPPFRIVRLGVSINGHHLTEVAGDGLIVCTPSGSTAHNLSAGGPILQGGVEAIVITPLCPHSLTHRPVVVERESVIEIRALAVNEGTTAIMDGQVSSPLSQGDVVTVRRFHSDFLLVRNPSRANWNNLVAKLHWGKGPLYNS